MHAASSNGSVFEDRLVVQAARDLQACGPDEPPKPAMPAKQARARQKACGRGLRLRSRDTAQVEELRAQLEDSPRMWKALVKSNVPIEAENSLDGGCF